MRLSAVALRKTMQRDDGAPCVTIGCCHKY
jgi:hypothetical protein